MLTSFFGKSKPINFLLSGAFLFLMFIGYEIKEFAPGVEALEYALRAACFLLLLFSLFLLDFIIRKNALCDNNNYALFLYTTFLTMIPEMFHSFDVVLSGVFLLLAFRRMVSLQSDQNSERKIFDATIWICLASFFYFMSFGMLGLLYISISLMKKAKFRYFLIPPVGLFTVFMITTSYYLLVEDSFNWIERLVELPGFDFSAYNSIYLLIPISVLGALLVWSGVSRFRKLGTIAKKDKANYMLVVYAIIAGAVVTALAPVKNGSEFIFSFPALAIIVANYLEFIEERYFKEGLLWITLLVPVGLLVLS